MFWLNIKREHLVGIDCTDPIKHKYNLNLSPNTKNLVIDEKRPTDIRILSITVNNRPTLLDIKNILLSLQKEYDSSEEVNIFTLNGKNVWLDSSTRLKILNRATIALNNNISVITLWFNNIKLDITPNKAIELINTVEDYASKCYDNTQTHYTEINQLKSIEACLQYDITAGYPAILNITLTD